MRKILGFLVCLAISIGMLILSLVSNSLTCTKSENKCVLNSTIRYLNIELNSDTAPIDSIKNLSCEKRIQPSKRGSKIFYQLKVKLPNGDYNISTYAKYKECRAVERSIKQDLKNPQINTIRFSSSSGFVSFIGQIFALVFFIIGIIILKSEDTPTEEDEDDEE